MAFPTGTKPKVFISYSRVELVFVDRLDAALRQHGIDTTVDRGDVAKGEDWWRRIRQLIAEADTIVFVLSPASADSEICLKEVEHAESLSKRFIPVVACDLAGKRPPAALARLNYVFFVPNPAVGADGDFDKAVAQTAEFLHSDIGWIREHTRLGTLAARWADRGYPRELVIRGKDLDLAETWLTTRPTHAPVPTDVHRAFITESRRAATARQRTAVALSLSALVVTLALSALALWQWQAAVASEQVAMQERNAALIGQAQVHAARAEDQIRDGRAGDALRLAIDALPSKSRDRPYVPVAEAALLHALGNTRERAVFEAGTDAVVGLDLSASGNHVLTWSEWGELNLWSTRVVARGRRLAAKVNSLHDGADAIVFAAFDRSGERVIATSLDHSALLWPSLGAPNIRLVGHQGPVRHAAFSPDGRLVVTASDDGTARVWRVDGASSLVTLEGHSKRVTHVAVNADGTRIATASEDGSARIWNAETFAHLATVRHASQIGFTRFSPDGGLVLVVSKPDAITPGRLLARSPIADTAALYHADTGKLVASLLGHADHIKDAEFSSDGGKLLTAAEDGTARVWSGPEWVNAGVYSDLPAEAYADLHGLRSGRFIDQGRGFITVGSDHKIRLWSLSSRSPVAVINVHQSFVSDLAINADRSLFATASGDGTARLFSTETLEGRSRVLFNGEPLVVDRAAVSQSGGALLVAPNREALRNRPLPSRIRHGNEDFTIRPFGHESLDGRRFAITQGNRVLLSNPLTGAPIAVLGPHTAVVSDVEFSRDGRYIATMCGRVPQPTGFGPRGKDTTVKIWDAEAGRLVATLANHGANVERVRFSGKTGKIVSGSHDGQARLWSLPDGRMERVLEAHRGPILDLAFSPDETLIVTVSQDGSGLLFRVVDGERVGELKGHAGAIESVSFSPDGRTIVTAARDGTARLWNAKDGSFMKLLNPGGRDLNFAAFVAEGRRIITAMVDPSKYLGDGAFGSWLNEKTASRAITIWDVATGEAIQRLPHEDAISSLSIANDGSLIVSASGVLHLWRPHMSTTAALEAAAGALPKRFASPDLPASDAPPHKH